MGCDLINSFSVKKLDEKSLVLYIFCFIKWEWYGNASSKEIIRTKLSRIYDIDYKPAIRPFVFDLFSTAPLTDVYKLLLVSFDTHEILWGGGS